MMIQATIRELHNRMSNADMVNLVNQATIRELQARMSTLETQLTDATGAIGDDKKLTDGEMFLILLRVSRIYRLGLPMLITVSSVEILPSNHLISLIPYHTATSSTYAPTFWW
jgi:hypothetical protein